MKKTNVENEEDQRVKAVATTLRAIASETRLRILYSLYQQPETWTKIMFKLKINPKSLRDHLQYLRDSGLVKRRKPVGFELTKAGIAVMELSIKDILERSRKG